MVVKYLDNWYVRDPQNDSKGRMGMLLTCRFVQFIGVLQM